MSGIQPSARNNSTPAVQNYQHLFSYVFDKLVWFESEKKNIYDIEEDPTIPLRI